MRKKGAYDISKVKTFGLGQFSDLFILHYLSYNFLRLRFSKLDECSLGSLPVFLKRGGESVDCETILPLTGFEPA